MIELSIMGVRGSKDREERLLQDTARRRESSRNASGRT
jgi:hypothetical protein